MAAGEIFKYDESATTVAEALEEVKWMMGFTAIGSSTFISPLYFLQTNYGKCKPMQRAYFGNIYGLGH
jgi:hypothetical protein